MKWFEKEYKERFENESTYDGIENGPLWDNISQAISQEKSEKKFVYWRWSILLIALIGVFATWFFLHENNIDTNVNEESAAIALETNENTVANNNSNNKVITENQSGIETQSNTQIENQTENSPEIGKISSESLNTTIEPKEITAANNENISTGDLMTDGGRNIKEEKILDTASNKDILTSNNNAPSNTKENQRINGNITNQDLNQVFSNNSNTSGQLTTKGNQEMIAANEDNNSEKVDESLVSNEVIERTMYAYDPLDILKMTVLNNKHILPIPAVPTIKVVRTNNKPWSISLHSKATFLDLKYSDVETPEIFANEANTALGPLQMGNSFGVMLDYQLNSSWSVSSGLEYNNYENKLQTIFSVDTFALDDNNVIRKAITTRTVRHHNKLTTYTIPLYVSYEYGMTRDLSMGASLGGSYSFVTAQNGRLLGRNSTILDYTENENVQFKNYLSMRINPFIRYRISDKLTFSVNGGISLQNHSKAEKQNLNQTSKIYSVGLGIHYKI